jgi:hypothetical protein
VLLLIIRWIIGQACEWSTFVRDCSEVLLIEEYGDQLVWNAFVKAGWIRSKSLVKESK